MRSIIATGFLFLLVSGALRAQETSNTVKWKAGESYKLEFQIDKTEGYTWELVNFFDTTYVTFAGKTFIPDPDTALHGKIGMEVFTFRAVKKGETRLEFAYKQPWKRRIPRLDKYKVIIEK